MPNEDTITLTRKEYDDLIERNSQLEDLLAAIAADDGVGIPHEIAVDIIHGMSPIRAYRKHKGMTLRELSEKTGIAAGYISEIERELKKGSVSALARIADALGVTMDVLVIE